MSREIKVADWRLRAEICGDVIYFSYVVSSLQREAKEVYVWDLDKTYLDTSWGSFRELSRTIMEKAFQKKNVPGTATLVRALTVSRGFGAGAEPFPIYFITASPPQIERKIREKLQFDGIYPYGTFYKDNLKNLRPKRMWRLTQQIGYKIQSLLQLRVLLREDVRQVLWGDDSESDAIIYSLYSDICSRRLSETEITQTLKGLHVTGEQLRVILDLQRQVPENDPVDKIYINLAIDTDPEYYVKFGRRMVPTENTFQASLDLFQDNRIKIEQVLRVVQDLIMNYEFTSEEIERSFDGLVRRQVLGQKSIDQLLPPLQEQKFISQHYKPSVPPSESANVRDAVSHDGIEIDPWVPTHIDYLHDYR